jgi:hypothetical protein
MLNLLLVRAPASNADRAEHVVPDRADVLPLSDPGLSRSTALFPQAIAKLTPEADRVFVHDDAANRNGVAFRVIRH